MHIVTHLLVGWNTAAAAGTTGRDLSLVAWAGVMPDLDGVGWAIDTVAERLGYADTHFYAIHHVYGHGLPAALAIAGFAALFAVHQRRTALLALLAAHLHLLCDLVGSRGLASQDLWEVSYLSPMSDALAYTWPGQWPVSSWQNTTISALLLGLCLVMAVWRGVTPVGLVSRHADAQVVQALRARWAALTGRGLPASTP